MRLLACDLILSSVQIREVRILCNVLPEVFRMSLCCNYGMHIHLFLTIAAKYILYISILGNEAVYTSATAALVLGMKLFVRAMHTINSRPQNYLLINT